MRLEWIMAKLDHKYCPRTRLSGRIRVGNVLSYHESKNIAFSSMGKARGKVTKISTKGKKAPSPEVASITHKMKEFWLLFSTVLACFRRSVIKPCYVAFETSALNSTYCAWSSCQYSWLRNEQFILCCSFSLRDSQSSMTLIPRQNLA